MATKVLMLTLLPCYISHTFQLRNRACMLNVDNQVINDIFRWPVNPNNPESYIPTRTTLHLSQSLNTGLMKPKKYKRYSVGSPGALASEHMHQDIHAFITTLGLFVEDFTTSLDYLNVNLKRVSISDYHHHSIYVCRSYLRVRDICCHPSFFEVWAW